MEDGRTITDIARKLGLSKSTICYHARHLGIAPDERFYRRYDWSAIQRYYDEGRSARECMAKFGCCSDTWSKARARGLLTTRPVAAPIETYLVRGRRVSRSHLKQRLLAAGLKENKCERCGAEEWLGSQLSMALHHINGDGDDNRLENISFLCPNCHSQTPNFSGRNIRSRAQLEKLGLFRLDRRRMYRLPVIGTAS